MDFEQRLERAIARGRTTQEARGRASAERRMTEAELRHLHSGARLELSEHIDTCLRSVADRFPGFTVATLASEDGWGSRISRDDVRLSRGTAENAYSRLELLVRSFSSTAIVEVVAKGTIRNRETINRTHYQRLSDLDLESFAELLDLWVLEYAEQYAAG